MYISYRILHKVIWRLLGRIAWTRHQIADISPFVTNHSCTRVDNCEYAIQSSRRTVLDTVLINDIRPSRHDSNDLHCDNWCLRNGCPVNYIQFGIRRLMHGASAVPCNRCSYDDVITIIMTSQCCGIVVMMTKYCFGNCPWWTWSFCLC